jgi:hypothetical protein
MTKWKKSKSRNLAFPCATSVRSCLSDRAPFPLYLLFPKLLVDFGETMYKSVRLHWLSHRQEDQAILVRFLEWENFALWFIIQTGPRTHPASSLAAGTTAPSPEVKCLKRKTDYSLPPRPEVKNDEVGFHSAYDFMAWSETTVPYLCWGKATQTKARYNVHIIFRPNRLCAALLVGRSRNRFPVVSLDFSETYSFRPHHGPGVDSTPSENEYQEHILGVKAAGVPNVMEIWEPKSPGTLWATPGLIRDCFRFIGLLVKCLRELWITSIFFLWSFYIFSSSSKYI